MNLFEKLGNQLNDFGKLSRDVVELTKLKLERSHLENEKYIKFTELGTSIYNLYTIHDLPAVNDECITNIYEKIIELEKQIDKIDHSIAKLEGQQTICSYCGAKISAESLFCRYCGQKLKVNDWEEEE